MPEENINGYIRAKQMYPVLFMLFEQATDLQWDYSAATKTVTLRSHNITDKLANFSEGGASYCDGVAVITLH